MTTPTPAQLRRFAMAILAKQDSGKGIDRPGLGDRIKAGASTSAQELLALWQEASQDPVTNLADEIFAKWEMSREQADREARRWEVAGFPLELALQWIAETEDPQVARILADRGWTPRMNHEFRRDFGGKQRTIASALAARLIPPDAIPTLAEAQEARTSRRQRQRGS